MGWWSKNIMGGDTPWDFEDIIYSVCGLEKWPANHPKGDPEAVIPKETFDSNMDSIIKAIEDYKTDQEIGFQVLGYLAMKFGATLSDELRKRIMESCDKDEWAKEDPKRETIILRLKKHIKNYKNIAVSETDLGKDYGVFAKLAGLS